MTRKGGGSALPYKRKLFESIVRTAVRTAAERNVPVTVKMRIGIDPEHITFTDAGRIAEDCGVAAVALHGRTAIQHYSGKADWDAIGTLKQLVTSIPVLGNGDIFAASDALAMMAAHRVRRCRGRARLPGPAVAVRRTGGRLRGAAGTDAARTCARWPPSCAGMPNCSATEMGPDRGIRDLRKHIAWYLKGFAVGSEPRRLLGMVSSLDELDDLLGRLDLDQPFPTAGDGPTRPAGVPAAAGRTAVRLAGRSRSRRLCRRGRSWMTAEAEVSCGRFWRTVRAESPASPRSRSGWERGLRVAAELR